MSIEKSALHPLSLRTTAIICSEGATIPSPSLKGKGDRVSGGRVCNSGMSVTAIEVSLKREGEEAEDLYLGRCRRLGFIGRRGYGFAITPLSLRDTPSNRGNYLSGEALLKREGEEDVHLCLG